MPQAISPTEFAAMVQALLGQLARYGVARRVCGPLLCLIWNHIRAIERRVLGLLAQIAAGAVRRYPGRRAPHPPGATRRRPTPGALPQGVLWLVRLVPETAWSASHLGQMLDSPELPQLLHAVPQLRRALRPLCHMLGTPLPRPSPPPPKSPAEAPTAMPAGSVPAPPPCATAPLAATPLATLAHPPSGNLTAAPQNPVRTA